MSNDSLQKNKRKRRKPKYMVGRRAGQRLIQYFAPIEQFDRLDTLAFQLRTKKAHLLRKWVTRCLTSEEARLKKRLAARAVPVQVETSAAP